MAKAKKVANVNIVKKTWYPILAPKMFSEQVVGEIIIGDISAAIGRTIPVNLMTLTGDMRRQGTNVIFKITNAVGSKLMTETIGYEMLPSSVKRLVKRGKNKVDYSMRVETSEGLKIAVKVVMVTQSLTNLSSLSRLRNTCNRIVQDTVKKMSFEAVIEELISYKMQSGMKKQLSKVYPLKIFEVRLLKLEPKAKISQVKKEEEMPEDEEDFEEEQEEAKPAEEIKEETEEETEESEETPAEEAD